MMRIAVRCLVAAATASALGLVWTAPANADAIAATTTCTNPFTSAQAGPSSFDLEVPATAVVGQDVQVTVSFDFANNSGYDISDLNTITQAIATTGTSQNPVTVTAGSQGAVPNGTSVTVTETGTWTPDQEGTATFTLGQFSFTTVVMGFTVPITCTFDSTPPSVSTEVSSS